MERRDTAATWSEAFPDSVRDATRHVALGSRLERHADSFLETKL